MQIVGVSAFEFRDVFADPLDLGVEPGGTPYPITGSWRAEFSAEVFKQREASEFTPPGVR